MSDPALAKAVSQTLPVLAGAASQATYTTQREFQQIVTSRLDDLRVAGSNEDFAAERNIWLRPLGGVVRQNGVADVPGYRARGAGVVAGIDHEVAPRLTLGGLFAYSHQSIAGGDEAIPNSLGINTYLAGLYGAYALKPDVELNFQLDAGLNRNSESRSISFMGSTASADYASYSTHAGLGVKKLIPATSALTFIPSLRMDFAQVQADAYTESGAGGLNLNVDSQTYRELTTTAGLTTVYRLANHVRLTANAGIGYNALDQQTQITASYAGGGGEFVTYGLNVSPWIYSAGVGLAGFKADRLDLSLRYDIQASPSGLLNQTGSLVFKMKL